MTDLLPHPRPRPRRWRSRLPVLVRVAAAGLVTGGAASLAMGATPASAASVNFTAAATAPILQITEDQPGASSHPELEGEYGYTAVTANPSFGNALATLVWPGALAGNAGTLATVLGGSSVPSQASALNDPVQASAATGSTPTHSEISAPTGSTMSASVDPTGPTDQHETATSALAGGGLGPAGSVGNSTSTSTIDFDTSTAVLSATAASKVSDVEIAGVVKIGTVTSSSSAIAVNGQTPTLAGSTTVHDLTIAGERAYVDGSGVHVGSAGVPAGPAAVESVDTALAATGMKIYFAAPHTTTVGEVAYYYAASVLFFWAPPNSSNTFTMSVGGAAVAVTDSPQADFNGFASDTGGGAVATDSPVATPASVDSTSAPSAPVPAPTAGPAPVLSLPGSPSAAAASAAGPPRLSTLAAGVRIPGGVGAGWFVLVAAAALAGAALTTRVPALLTRRAASACPHSQGPRSSTGNQKEAS
jgi:hypothetical protein